ncbi:MAG: CBS domain-containing protein [Myxococcaceae bacterium]
MESKHPQPDDHSIFCPVLGHSTDVERCVSCEQCEHVRLNDPHGKHVICRAARAPSPLPPRTGQHLSVDGALALLLEHTKVSEVMTTEVTCVAPDLPAKALAELLIQKRFSGVPVVDREGKPIGMVSKTDLLREAHETYAWKCPTGTVAEVMTESAFGLPESSSLAHAAALMAYERVHRVPILSADGKVVGIVTPIDLARWLATRAGYVVPRGSGEGPR